MNATRTAATIVLAAGAAASIATSQVSWQLVDGGALPERTVTAEQRWVKYLIKTELIGPVSEPSGAIEIDLEIGFGAGESYPAALFVLLNDDGVDNLDSQDAIVAPANPRIHLSVPAWLSCTATPCGDEFQLWVERFDSEDPAINPVTISGDVEVTVNADGDSEPPPGAELVVTITEVFE